MLGVPARIWDQAGVDDIGTVANYLSSFESRCEPFQLPLELRWVNLQQCVLGQDRFRGKVVVVDFFTYCCINCLHILPTLAKLERRWKTSDGLLIVGVHSAKFENEKDAENLANAIIRLNINHPVLADNELELWNRLGIHCWPTVLIVGNGRILFELVGETNINQCLEIYVEEVINYYKNGNRLDLNEVGFKLSSQANESSACTTRSVLRFPGKVAYSQDCTRIAISDSGNNRILVTDVDGDIQVVIGCGIAGFENGTFKEARFCCPQGVCWSLDSSKIFVADTENHALREVNLESKTVTTLAGTGVQGSDATGGKPALEQEISSPWDLTIARITFEDEPQIVADVLFIAMAGSHQIWLLLFQDLKLPKLKKSFTAGCLYAFAGSGTEACQNNVYAHKASFAQPSGVCFAERTQTLYIADAESSSIRQLNVISGAVQHVAGGDRNPQNLFAFGDQDGVGFDAKLQHPLGIALDGDQFLYCADTYNHKIKRINLAICELTTVVAASSSCKAKDGGAASANGGVYFGLSEPGGLCYNPNSGVLLIADTNNHSLVRFNTISKSFDRVFPYLRLLC